MALSSIMPLTPQHKTGNFDCGEEALNIWLRETALSNQQKYYASSYVITDNEQQIIAYYALCTSMIYKQDMPRRLHDNSAPRELPAILLARLGVDKAFQKQRLGGYLLLDAFKRTAQAAQISAARVLITHPIHSQAENFYLKHGFLKLRGNKEALFIPLAVITAILRQS